MKIMSFQIDAKHNWSGQEGLLQIETRLRVASEQGAELAQFPELTLPGYGAGEELLRKAAASTPTMLDQLSQMVSRFNVSLLLGMPALNGNTLTNIAAMLRPGKQPLMYTKRFLFGEYERQAFSRGNMPSPIFEIGGLRAGLLVCYDVEFPENVRELALAGADLVLVPTALPAIKGSPFIAKNLIPTRAFENSVFVSYCDWCGQDTNFSYQGMSVIAAPDGSILAQGKSVETTLQVDIDPSAYNDLRTENGYLSEIRTHLSS